MNRRSFLGAATSAAAQAAWPRTPALQLANTSESEQRIARAMRAALAMQRRDWEQGILAQAALEAGDREQVILLTRAAMLQATADGRMGVVVRGGPTDPAMGGVAYAKAAQWTHAPEIQRAVDALLGWIQFKAPRSNDGILYHVFDGREMWSDGFNCAPPFLAAMGSHDEALKQIEGYRQRLWNEKKQLLHHIWDDDQKQFGDATFWGGGNGWAAAGLARVIRILPPAPSADRRRLVEFAHAVIEGCLAYQRPDGLFHNVVDDCSTFVETNLSQMLAYAIYCGLNDGWLPVAYRARADRMRDAARAKMDPEGFVQGACSAPNFDRPGISTEAQAFCILMEAAGQAEATR